jgi:hypothetical protein
MDYLFGGLIWHPSYTTVLHKLAVKFLFLQKLNPIYSKTLNTVGQGLPTKQRKQMFVL